MRLSIVTPVFRDPRVTRALDSIASQQDAPEVEIIVVNGGDDRETREAIQKSRDTVDVLVEEPDRGLYDAINKGIARATGDVVGILNADDLYADNHVLRDVAQAFVDPRVDVTYGDVLLVDEAARPRRLWRAGAFDRSAIRWGWMPPHPGFFVRRELYEKHGAFRLDLPISADYEHQLRLFLLHGARPAYLGRVLVRFTIGGASSGSWRKVLQNNVEVRRAWRVNRLRGGWLAPFLKPARKLPQYIRAKVSVME